MAQELVIFQDDFDEGLDEWLDDLLKARKEEIDESLGLRKIQNIIENDEVPLSPKKAKPLSPVNKQKELSPPQDMQEDLSLIVQDIVQKVIENQVVKSPPKKNYKENVEEDVEVKEVDKFDPEKQITDIQVVFEDPDNKPELIKGGLKDDDIKEVPKCIETGIKANLFVYQKASVINMINLAKKLEKNPDSLFKGNIVLHDAGTGKTLIIDTVVECLLSGYVDKAYIITTTKVKEQIKKTLEDQVLGYKEIANKIKIVNFESAFRTSKNLEEIEKNCSSSLLVIDEAHKLRNLLKNQNKKPKKPKDETKEPKEAFSKRINTCAMNAKIVLVDTATPYFKSISDVYALFSLIFNPNNALGFKSFIEWISKTHPKLSPEKVDSALEELSKYFIEKNGLSGIYKRQFIIPLIETVETLDLSKKKKAAIDLLSGFLGIREFENIISIYKPSSSKGFPEVTKKYHFIDSLSGSDDFVKLYKSQGKKSWKQFLEKYEGAPDVASGKEFQIALRGSFAIPNNKGIFFHSPKLNAIYEILQPVIKNNKQVENQSKEMDDPKLYLQQNIQRVLFKVTYIDNLNLLKQFLESLGLGSKLSVVSGEAKEDPQKAVKLFASGEKPFVIITQAGQEGLDFKAIHDLIVVDIPYTWSDIIQIFGRGVRVNSHKDVSYDTINIHLLILSNFKQQEDISLDKLLTVFRKNSKELPSIDTLLFLKALQRRHAEETIMELLNTYSIQKQEFTSY